MISLSEKADLLGKGLLALKNGDVELASELLRKLVELDPSNDNAWYLLGEAYVELKDYPRAQVSFIQSAEINPKKSAKSWIRMGDLYMMDQNIKEAIKMYTKATENEPENFEAWQHLGMVHVYTDEKKAINFLLKSYELNPKEIMTLVSLGTLYDLQKNYEKAIDFCQKALELDFKNTEALRVLGSAIFKTGRRGLGIETVKKAVDFDPKFTHGWLTLGTLYHHMGNTIDADRCRAIAKKLMG